jgi:ABC-type multidrug transport system fused ATPase/permease subunit
MSPLSTTMSCEMTLPQAARQPRPRLLRRLIDRLPGPSAAQPAMRPPALRLNDLAYFWKFMTGHRAAALGIVGLLLMVSALQLAPAFAPVALAKLGTAQDGRRVAFTVLAGLLAASLLATGGQFLADYLSAQLGESLGRKIKVTLFSKIGSLPSSQVNSHSIGALAFRVGGDVQQIREFFIPGLTQTAGEVFVLLVAFTIMAIFAWPYALLCLAATIIIALAVRRSTRRVNQFAFAAQMASEQSMTQYIEGVAGYRDLAASGRFHRAVEEYDRRLGHQQQAVVSTFFWGSVGSLAPQMFFMALYFGYYFLTAATPNSSAAPSEHLAMAVTFVSVLAYIRGPVVQLSQFGSRVAGAAPSFAKVRELLQAPEVVASGSPMKVADGRVEFDRVSFSYSPDAPPVLHDLSFEIKPGSFTAIVGQSGSGKTSLFHLLLRLLDPTSGSIRVGGAPLAKIAVPELRQKVGFIPQSPFIFDSSIRDNLTLGAAGSDDQAHESAVNEAVRLARLDELVERRSAMGGLDAPVGPGGVTLSGGERQRIALGRLFLRDPQVIVCDEYTANIDNATAALIRESLATKFADRTRIVVTHQLYSVRGADQILVLDKGRIVDRGTHEDLLARPGLYREMWELQRID